jgi:hypothetical protein
MPAQWDQIWVEIQDGLRRQPRCPEHPEYHCLRTIGQEILNDIISVSDAGVTVRSHRTFRERQIPAGDLQNWWNRLLKDGALYGSVTGHGSIIRTILVECLPERIDHAGGKHLRLVDADQDQPACPVSVDDVANGVHAESTEVEAQIGAGFGDAVENSLVESAAIRAVVESYENDGWSARSVERDKCGFDLVCSKGAIVENVEVKGIKGEATCFLITAGEVEQARTNPNFFLVVVTSALSQTPVSNKYSGNEFLQRFDLRPIQYKAVLKS